MSKFNLNRNWLLLAAAVLCMAGCASASSDAGAPAKGGSSAANPVVVRIGDEALTLEQVDEKGRTLGIKPYQDLYEHRRQTIEQMVAENLMDREAKKRGITRDELLKQEVNDKAAAVTDADVSTFYEQNKPSMGGRELDDDLRVQIRTFLGQQKQMLARQDFLKRLRADTPVKITLDAPRVELVVAPTEPAKGPANAPVTIVEYSDFQCPFCARVGPTLERIAQTYPDKVRIVFRDFPLGMHPEAQPAAEAAKCAHEQGQFWPYHDKLFASQKDLGGDSYKKFAEQLGLDTAKFAACFDGGRYRQDVMLLARGGQQAGVSGTPAFFINGRFLSGAIPFERFQAVIDEELAQ